MASKEECLQLPRSVVIDSCGFSVDIGGSQPKLLYRALADKEHNDNDKNALGNLRIKLFPKGAVADIVKFLSENCDLNKKANQGNWYSTGIGSASMRELVESKLNLKIKVLVEHDCFAMGLKVVYESDKSAIIRPGVSETARKLEDDMKVSMDKVYLASNGKAESKEAESKEAESVFPCILVLCGSGVLFTKVNSDGSQHMVDGYGTGGRTFLALAQQLVGVRDFNKLMDMAGRGDTTNVDVSVADVKKEEACEGVYASLPDTMPLHIFAKPAVGGEYKPDDLVSSLLNMWCAQLAQMAHLVATVNGVHRLFLCGGFVDHERVRELTCRHFIKRNGVAERMGKPNIDFGFVKNGRLLGAIGSYIHKE